MLATLSFDSLPVGQSYQKTSSIRIPEEFEGQAFVHIRTGKGLFEHTFTQNNQLVLPVTVNWISLPDLRILTFSALATPTQNETIVFRTRVKNTGNLPTFAKPLELRISASKAADFEGSTVIGLASGLLDSLDVNEEQVLDIPVLIPPGYSG